MKLKIYHVYMKSATAGYDEYEDVVLVAENEEEAKEMAIKHCHNFKRKKLIAEQIGFALKGLEKQIITASFHAA